MRFLKILSYLGLACLTSFYFFPFEFRFLPSVNTKMMLAAVGLVVYGIQLASGKTGMIDKSFFILSIAAIMVSLVSYAAAVVNNTIDYTYADYIVSMWVWLGGAYTVVTLIRLLHGKASVILVCNYLIAVCVLQCGLALAIDNIPAVENIVNLLVADLGFIEMDRLNGAGRLYGVGCCLDVAGTRFAAILILIAFITCHLAKRENQKWQLIYFVAFAIIVVVGNMISRTSTVGVGFALLIWGIYLFSSGQDRRRNVLKPMLLVIGCATVFSVVLYNLDPNFRSNIRFAFEGFFSLVEKGHWETNSNNMLQNMVVFPETIHTWLIGDGYMLNPFDSDPNYVGEDYGGFYMSTDIGYLRFIFYFGIIGLAIFSIYFIMVAGELMKRHESFRWMYFTVLILLFIIWFKVSTDIFLVFALFLCVRREENDEYEKELFATEEETIEGE